MLTAYIEAVMRHALLKEGNDGTYFGSIEMRGFEGVWSHEPSPDGAQSDLRGTLEDWMLLGLRLNHRLPVVDGIDLNPPGAALCGANRRKEYRPCSQSPC